MAAETEPAELPGGEDVHQGHILPSAQTSLEQWIEWKDMCQLARCSGTTQASLARFADGQLKKYVVSEGGKQMVEAHAANDFLPHTQSLSDTRVTQWAYFENHLVAGRTREGKRYKDWLFDHAVHAKSPAGSIIKGACGLLRTVARSLVEKADYLTRARMLVSLDAPVGAEDGASTRSDFIAEPMNELSITEMSELNPHATRMAEAWWPELSRRERLALFSLIRDISAANKQLLECADCEKSVLYTARNKFTKTSIIQRIRAEPFADGLDGHAVAYTATILLECLASHVEKWAESEKQLACFFSSLQTMTTTMENVHE